MQTGFHVRCCSPNSRSPSDYHLRNGGVVGLVLQGPKMQRRSRDRLAPFFLNDLQRGKVARISLARPKTIDSLASVRNSARLDDKSPGCGTFKSERVTGHEGQNCVIGIVQHFRVLGINHFDRIHAIAVESSQRF